jgi:propanol-preferring alcohol dehydrogenase
VDLPPPAPGPGQILIQVEYCGLCRTDLHLAEGELPPEHLPVIPGHQAVGKVVDQGPGVLRFQPGQPVGLAWLRRACGVCKFCRSGRENLCTQARFTGLHRDGGLAEIAVAHEDFVYPLPESLKGPEAAPLLGAGVLAYRALKASGVQCGGTVGLYGFGAAAQLALMVARQWGCQVYVFSRSQAHQKLAREMGAVWAGQPQAAPPLPLDAAIMLAPAGNLAPAALAALDRGGVLVLAATYLTPLPSLDLARHLAQDKTLRSITAHTRRDAQEWLDLAIKARILPRVETFALEEANEALKRMKEGKLNGAAVVVM